MFRFVSAIAASISFLSISASAQLPDADSACYEVNEITAEELLSWFEQGVPMVVVDARGRRFFDHRTLPGAIWVPCSASDEVLTRAVPDKQALTIVYCSNIECPASNWVAGRLMQLGYTDVYEYPGGIDAWTALGYPLEPYSNPR